MQATVIRTVICNSRFFMSNVFLTSLVNKVIKYNPIKTPIKMAIKIHSDFLSLTMIKEFTAIYIAAEIDETDRIQPDFFFSIKRKGPIIKSIPMKLSDKNLSVKAK